MREQGRCVSTRVRFAEAISDLWYGDALLGAWDTALRWWWMVGNSSAWSKTWVSDGADCIEGEGDGERPGEDMPMFCGI